MRTIYILAKLSMLENARKHVFHVLCLIILAVVAGSTLLSIFTDGVRLKIIKDLCMTSIFFGGGLLAIVLGSSGIPADIETRNLYPLLGRPVTRVQYLLGKYLGGMLTIAIAILIMSLAFGVLIVSFEHKIDPFLILAILFTLLQTAIILAVSITISTFTSSPIAAILTFLAYIMGTVKIGYLGHMLESANNIVSKMLFGVIYHALPNLECFNLKDALVHHDGVPASYMLQVLVYGILYIAVVLSLGSAIFAKKEI